MAIKEEKVRGECVEFLRVNQGQHLLIDDGLLLSRLEIYLIDKFSSGDVDDPVNIWLREIAFEEIKRLRDVPRRSHVVRNLRTSNGFLPSYVDAGNTHVVRYTKERMSEIFSGNYRRWD